MTFKDKKTTVNRKTAVLEEIKTRADRCYDQIVPISRLYRRPDCEMFQLINPEVVLPMGTRPEGQLLQRINIPASYIHRCPNDLQATNINFWLQHFGKTKLTLRMLKSTEEDGDDYCRAIFSKVYKPLDDKDVFPLVFDGLELAAENQNINDLHVKDWSQDQDFTLLRTLYSSRHVEYNGRYFWAGVMVINSETGLSALWIRPTIRTAHARHGGYDLSDAHDEGATRLIHTQRAAANLQSISIYVQEALRVAEVGITRLIEADQEMVENPVQVVTDWVNTSDALSKRIVAMIEAEYRDQQRASRLELAQSILLSVKDLPTFQRYLTERETGRFLKLFGGTTKQLQKVVQSAKEESIE